MESISRKSRMDKGNKLGHRREKDGEVTYKTVGTIQLMESLQLGIRESMEATQTKEDLDLVKDDFSRVETMEFPRNEQLSPFKVVD